MARYGKAFRKKSSKGNFRKGTWVRYKYVGNRRVATVLASQYRRSSRTRKSYSSRRMPRRYYRRRGRKQRSAWGSMGTWSGGVWTKD